MSVTLNVSCRPKVWRVEAAVDCLGPVWGPYLSPSHLPCAGCEPARRCSAPGVSSRPRPPLAPPPGGVASLPNRLFSRLEPCQ